MDITVLTYYIGLHHLLVEHVGVTINIILTCQHLEVAVVASHRHVVVQHILTCEMHHRSDGVVKHSQNLTVSALET